MSEIKKLFIIYLGANDLNITTIGDDLKKTFDNFIDECENYNCENYLELMADVLHSNQYSPGKFSIGVLYYIEDYLTDLEIYTKFVATYPSSNTTFVGEDEFESDELFKIVVGYELIEGHDQDLSDWLDVVNSYYDENDMNDIILVDPTKFQGVLDPDNIQLYELSYEIIDDGRRDWIEISKELDTDWEYYIYNDELDDDELDDDSELDE